MRPSLYVTGDTISSKSCDMFFDTRILQNMNIQYMNENICSQFFKHMIKFRNISCYLTYICNTAEEAVYMHYNDLTSEHITFIFEFVIYIPYVYIF